MHLVNKTEKSSSSSPAVKRLPADPDRIRAAQAAAKTALERARAALKPAASTTALIKQKVAEQKDKSTKRARINLNEPEISFDSSRTPTLEWWDAQLPAELDSLIPTGAFLATAALPAIQEARLTPKERAKLQKLQKRAATEEVQRKIKAGEIPPPPPKTKLRNLARILGTAADPSQAELSLRQNIAQRILDSRKTPETKVSEKKVEEIYCEVFVVDVQEISDQQRFKVGKNAKQLSLSGVAVQCRNRKFLLVVQGGKKALRKFSALILRRVVWETTIKQEEDGQTSEQLARRVWVGPVTGKQEMFHKFRWVEAASEAEARRTAGKFWDFATR